MKLSERDKVNLISTVFIVVVLALFYISIHLESMAGICASSILLLVGGVYSFYWMYENSVDNAKRVAKKFTKEELEEPIRLSDFRGGKLGMKLTMRYGGYAAGLAILGLEVLFVAPSLFVWFYFTGWPDNYAWLWGIVIFDLFLTYVSAKTFEEAAVILKEEEWK